MKQVLLENSYPIKLKFIINIINFFIELGPQIIGSIFLVISFNICSHWLEILLLKLQYQN